MLELWKCLDAILMLACKIYVPLLMLIAIGYTVGKAEMEKNQSNANAVQKNHVPLKNEDISSDCKITIHIDKMDIAERDNG